MASRPIHPVILRRNSVLMVLRLAASLMVVLGLLSFVYSIISGLSIRVSLSSMFMTYDQWNYGALGITLLACGFALGWSSNRVARWVVPAPRDECPRCAYALRSIAGNRCPECGFQFADNVIGPQ